MQQATMAENLHGLTQLVDEFRNRNQSPQKAEVGKKRNTWQKYKNTAWAGKMKSEKPKLKPERDVKDQQKVSTVMQATKGRIKKTVKPHEGKNKLETY